MSDPERYRCPTEDCGWEGTENEMGADFVSGGDDEMWSNWICPKCGSWLRLEDYTLIEPNEQARGKL